MESCNRSSVKSNHWLLLLLLLLRNCIYPLKSSARLKKSISFRKRGSSINAVAFTHNDSVETLMNWVTLISCPKPLTIDVQPVKVLFTTFSFWDIRLWFHLLCMLQVSKSISWGNKTCVQFCSIFTSFESFFGYIIIGKPHQHKY